MISESVLPSCRKLVWQMLPTRFIKGLTPQVQGGGLFCHREKDQFIMVWAGGFTCFPMLAVHRDHNPQGEHRLSRRHRRPDAKKRLFHPKAFLFYKKKDAKKRRRPPALPGGASVRRGRDQSRFSRRSTLTWPSRLLPTDQRRRCLRMRFLFVCKKLASCCPLHYSRPPSWSCSCACLCPSFLHEGQRRHGCVLPLYPLFVPPQLGLS